jgi:hypothetical protein
MAVVATIFANVSGVSCPRSWRFMPEIIKNLVSLLVNVPVN